MAQRLPTRCNPDDRLDQRVLAGTMIKALLGHDHRLGHYLMRRLSRGISPPMVAAVFVLA